MKTMHDSILSSGMSVTGNIFISGSLLLSGTVHGDLVGSKEETSTVRVMEGGFVNGLVSVSHLIVAGQIKGDVYADESLVVLPGAVIEGNIFYRSANIHAGAVVSGRMTQTSEAFSDFDRISHQT